MLLINFNSYDDKNNKYKKIPSFISFLIGGVLGFFSGVVGIGGGIFLSPILFLLKAAKPKQIVTAASLFILINSISGIFGHLTKSSLFNEIQNYWFLLLAVFIGGQIGNFLNLKIFPARILALVTAGLVYLLLLEWLLKYLINFMDKDYFKKLRILDGGMGQDLLERGLVTKGTLWSSSALLEEKNHKLIIDSHLSFINAGAEVILYK